MPTTSTSKLKMHTKLAIEHQKHLNRLDTVSFLEVEIEITKLALISEFGANLPAQRYYYISQQSALTNKKLVLLCVFQSSKDALL